MNRSILIQVALAAIVLTGFAQPPPSQPITGTCASIGYSTSCCPRGANCRAADGNCSCNADCHTFGDCCPDIACPRNPRTCADIGIHSCCTNSRAGACEVRNGQHNCTCNISCHGRGDCCADAVTLCIPQTCTEAGKSPGSCMWSVTSSCFVPGGQCYCDSQCSIYNDCCSDVQSR